MTSLARSVQGEEAVRGDRADVAGTQPAVLGELVLRALRVLAGAAVVGTGDPWAADLQLACGEPVVRHPLAARAGQPGLHGGRKTPWVIR